MYYIIVDHQLINNFSNSWISSYFPITPPFFFFFSNVARLVMYVHVCIRVYRIVAYGHVQKKLGDSAGRVASS